ncbi:hypothetical protein [Moraxella lincolnii]|uniref:hypothetical protein n=1 Tax=Lwoffella lincolnii TaxID=90241 RepID=UPI0030CA6F54
MRWGFTFVKCAKYVGIGGVCALVLIGCDRHKDKPTVDPQAQSEQIANATTETKVDCQSYAMIRQMHNAVMDSIGSYVGQAASAMMHNGNVALSSGVLADKTASLFVDIQNIRQGSTTQTGMTTCQASVSVAVANEDMFQANQLFAFANQPSLEQRLAKNNIELNNNRLVDNHVTFVLSPANDGNTVKLAGDLPLLELVGNVITSATLKQRMDAEQTARRQRIEQQIAQEQQKAYQAAQELSHQLAQQESNLYQEPQTITPSDMTDSLTDGHHGNHHSLEPRPGFVDTMPTPSEPKASISKPKPKIEKVEKLATVTDVEDMRQDSVQLPEFHVPGADDITMRIIETDETY